MKLAKQEVKKHVGAVHINNKLSLIQRKISNVLLLNAYDELQTKDTHEVSIRAISKLIGLDSNNLEVLKTALTKLVETIIEWNILDEEGKKEWGVSSILAHAIIKNGICQYSYSPALREKLYNPDIFTKIKLEIQKRFNSCHALALYENCYRFKDVETTGTIPLDLFRKLIGVEDSKVYSEFKELNQKIIKPAVKEVNLFSDIHLECKFEKEGRRVAALRFIIKKNPQPMLPMNYAASPIDQRLLQRLKDFGLSQEQALEEIISHEESYISENLDVVEERWRAGAVSKNLTAYTIKALKDDFRPKAAPIEKERQKNKDKLLAEKTKKKESEEKKTKEEQEKREQAKKQFEQLSGAARAALIKEFEHEIKSKNQFIYSYYQQGLNEGKTLFEMVGVKIAFFIFVADKVSSPEKA